MSDRELRHGRGGRGRAAPAGRQLREFRLAQWPHYTFKHKASREEGFDLGDYFVAVGADYRWSRAAYRRVAAAMAARNVSAPTLINYRCVRHTWACMQPMFEVGPMAAAGPACSTR